MSYTRETQKRRCKYRRFTTVFKIGLLIKQLWIVVYSSYGIQSIQRLHYPNKPIF